MNRVSISGRRCLACNAVEPVAANEAVWPPEWRCFACGHLVGQSGGIPMFAPELADTISGMDPHSFEALSKVEAEHFWFVARNELIVGLITKFFPDARRFLEIGCGNGAVLRAIAQSRLGAGGRLRIASVRTGVRATTSAGRVEFVQMDARNIPAVGVFDLTGAFDVIEHIADDEGVLRGMRAATQTGGGTLIAVPQHPWLWSHADDVAYHQRRYRRGELEAKLRRNGFEVLYSSSFTALLLPLMVASRLKSRHSKRDDDIEREFAVNRHVNGFFTAILRAEVRMTLAGMSWPAGGSRIVVGRAV